MAAWCLGDQEVDGDLALGREQRAEAPLSRLKLRHIGGDQAIEKVARVLAGNLDHAPVGKKRCLHAKTSLEVIVEPQRAEFRPQVMSLSSWEQGPRGASSHELTLPADDRSRVVRGEVEVLL